MTEGSSFPKGGNKATVQEICQQMQLFPLERGMPPASSSVTLVNLWVVGVNGQPFVVGEEWRN